MRTQTHNIFKRKQNRFNMSYKEGEVEILQPIEESLMKDLGIFTKTDLYKYCLKQVFNLRSAAALNVS